MNSGVVLIEEAPQSIALNEASIYQLTKAGLEFVLGISRRRIIIHRILAQKSNPSAFQRCLSGSTATQTSTKSSLGTVLPLTTERVARKRLTKPPELEQVEHVNSFDSDSMIKGLSSAQVLRWIVESLSKLLTLESCFRPMRSRE